MFLGYVVTHCVLVLLSLITELAMQLLFRLVRIPINLHVSFMFLGYLVPHCWCVLNSFVTEIALQFICNVNVFCLNMVPHNILGAYFTTDKAVVECVSVFQFLSCATNYQFLQFCHQFLW